MRKFLLSLIAVFSSILAINAQNAKDLTWANICSGRMPAEWYSSQEAQDIADIVLSVQKTNGGWMKNDQLHKLTSSELTKLINARGEHSCLDNYATTQEMRFLARVYQGTKVEKYRESIVKAINLILTAEFKNGGWGQYYPLSTDKYSYQNYITFNDDLVTNVMKMLRDVYEENGDFKGITDEATRNKCVESFNRGIEMIIKCQIDDNGTKAAWCAQHDPEDYLPTEGRPHELPSVSGYESASLLTFLMSIDNPSKELKECITSAIEWLDNHKIVGKAIEDYTNAKGEKDRRIIDREGSCIWGRFIQIGGESGKKIFDKFVAKLKARGKSRSYTWNGKTYNYYEWEIATASYNTDMAYKPIFAIYDNNYAHLFYRYLYNYEDTDPVIDSKGCQVATSIAATNRSSYQYLGSWCQSTINTEYPAWKKKIEAQESAGDTKLYTLSAETYDNSIESGDNITYKFKNGFTVTNAKGKKYGTGKSNTIKYSAAVPYSINIPEGMTAVKVSITGYDNYEGDAYLSNFNGTTYSSTDYVFPEKNPDPVFVTHTIDLSSKPATGTIPFTVAVKQCCLTFDVYCANPTSGIRDITTSAQASARKFMENGRMVISHDNRKYNAVGQEL